MPLDDKSAWLDAVYSDTTLVVQHRPHPTETWGANGKAIPTGSSTMPSLMVEILEALQIKPGHRVLEIVRAQAITPR
jgi:protein-L-isoaspartate O-methyltransferase